MNQARRLGEHLASRAEKIGPITHIFASNLQRAFNTAREVAIAQKKPDGQGGGGSVAVQQVAELREKHFGSLEGTAFGSRSALESPRDVESAEQMLVRVNGFIYRDLLPKLAELVASEEADARPQCMAIVAHGIILNILTRALLARLAPQEFTRLTGAPPNVSSSGGGGGSVVSEFSIPWRNTGYVEAVVSRQPPAEGPADIRLSGAIPNLKLRVLSVNNHTHLDGLRKTKGGIGSAAFDSKQKTMDSFFRPAR